MNLAEALEQMHGQPDRIIAEATGEPLWKVREWRRAAGIKATLERRLSWTRRQWLLCDSAGLTPSKVALELGLEEK